MPRTFDPRRRCLHVTDWPPADRVLWERVTGPVDLLDENRTKAAKWCDPTRHKNRRGYGRWICFLMHTGSDLAQPPADRVTRERVSAYIAELKGDQVEPYTLRNRIGELLAVMLVFIPDRDWGWLKRTLNDLDAQAKEAYEPKPPPLFANEIIAICRKRLTALEDQPYSIHRRLAVEYRNVSMILFLAVLPLRLRNLTALSERHLKTWDTEWLVDIPAAETKTGVRIVAPLPDVVVRHLAFYLAHVRRVLLGNQASDQLWLTCHGEPMCDHTVYLRITETTQELFGQAINPHRFRHTDATTISIVAPGEVDSARALLGQRSSKTTRDHYIIGDGIRASRRRATLIRSLRRRLPGPKRKKR
jgi:integrase